MLSRSTLSAGGGERRGERESVGLMAKVSTKEPDVQPLALCLIVAWLVPNQDNQLSMRACRQGLLLGGVVYK